MSSETIHTTTQLRSVPLAAPLLFGEILTPKISVHVQKIATPSLILGYVVFDRFIHTLVLTVQLVPIGTVVHQYLLLTNSNPLPLDIVGTKTKNTEEGVRELIIKVFGLQY